MDDKTEVKKLLNKIINGDHQSLLILGDLYFNKKTYDLAFYYMKKAFNKGIESALSDEFITSCKYSNLCNKEEYIYYLVQISNTLIDGFPWYLGVLVDIYIDDNQEDLALEYCKKAYDIAPYEFSTKMAEIYINLYLYHSTLENFNNAKKYIEIAMNFGFDTGLGFLGRYYRNKGLYKKSIEYFLLLMESGDETCFTCIVETYILMGEKETAEKYFLKALNQHNPKTYIHLAKLYKDTDLELAISYLIEGAELGFMTSLVLLEEFLLLL